MVAAPQPPLRLLVGKVHDGAEPIAQEALRHGEAEMRAEAPEDLAELVIGVFVGRQAAHDHETAPGRQLLLEGCYLGGDGRKWKICRANVLERLAALAHAS